MQDDVNISVRYLSKDEAQTVACPRCEAPVGEPCRRTDGFTGNHANRVNAAAKELGVRLPHQNYRTGRRRGSR
jgi:hypothetical protein